MKSRKWITYTLGVLFTLIALAGVGLAGFRIGLMQSGVFSRKELESQKADGKPTDPQQMPFFDPHHGYGGDFNNSPHGGFDNQRGFRDGRDFGRNRRGEFFSPLFGLFHLVVLGLAIWIGYMLFKKSGWQFVHIPASEPEVEVKASKKKK